MISNFAVRDFLLILDELNHISSLQEKRTKGWMTDPCKIRKKISVQSEEAGMCPLTAFVMVVNY